MGALLGMPAIASPPVTGAETVTPAWSPTSPMGGVNQSGAPLPQPRTGHTATLLNDGRVLVAGGCAVAKTSNCPKASLLASAEVYDPRSEMWQPIAPMDSCASPPTTPPSTEPESCVARSHHSATLLDPPGCNGGVPPVPEDYPCGKVLVAGGFQPEAEQFAERPQVGVQMFDPGATSNPWSPVGDLTFTRRFHTATLLADGDVLVVGGTDGSDIPTTEEAERLDPTEGTWSPAGLHKARGVGHAASLLTGPVSVCGANCGKVLVVGGEWHAPDLYYPETNTWIATGTPVVPSRRTHEVARLSGEACRKGTVAACGRVLLAGGSPLPADTEVYNPATGAWAPTGGMTIQRAGHRLVVLDGAPCRGVTPPAFCGNVLAAGGHKTEVGEPLYRRAELYDPATGAWKTDEALDMVVARRGHTATVLSDGRVLVAGGMTSDQPGAAARNCPGESSALCAVASAEIYDPMAGASDLLDTATSVLGLQPNQGPTYGGTSVVITATNARNVKQVRFGDLAATIRPEGVSDSALEVVVPAQPRGTVPVTLKTAAGRSAATDVARYTYIDDAAQRGLGAWSVAALLGTARIGHTATSIAGAACASAVRPEYCGRVLVAGGSDAEGRVLNSTEVYDPGGGSPTWVEAPPMSVARSGHSATPLPDGRVLVMGGDAAGSIEIFTPSGPAGSWSDVTSRLLAPRIGHTATRLDGARCRKSSPPRWCGKVLVVGGLVTDTEAPDDLGLSAEAMVSAELFDPDLGVSRATGPLQDGRHGHVAALLGDGRVLVSGSGHTAEVYDPETELWTQDPVFEGGSATRLDGPRCRADSPPSYCAGVLGGGGGIATRSVKVRHPRLPRSFTTGSFNDGREEHTATLLDGAECRRAGARPPAHCGKVLAVGGVLAPHLAELFDPAADDDGTAEGADGAPQYRVEISGRWQRTASLATGRWLHTATLLDGPQCEVAEPTRPSHCGSVMVTGGRGTRGVLRSVEIFTPVDLAPPATTLRALPTAGPTFGGTRVLIEGEGLGGTTAVKFGGVDGTLLHVGDEAVVALAPPQPQGRVTVRLIQGGTTAQEASPTVAFTYGAGAWFGCNAETASESCPGPLTQGRYFHTATVLEGPRCRGASPPDYCGNVLVTGGARFEEVDAPEHLPIPRPGPEAARGIFSELFDPSKGTSRATRAPMSTTRSEHTATILDGEECHTATPPPTYCGKVLVVGGQAVNTGAAPGDDPPLATAELYDPERGTWTTTGPLNDRRFAHTATLLTGALCAGDGRPSWCGKVLVVGGIFEDAYRRPVPTAELYDPKEGTWTTTSGLDSCSASSPSCEARSSHAAVSLPDGSVLVSGGLGRVPDDDPLKSDRVCLQVGFCAQLRVLDSALRYDPGLKQWVPTTSLGVPRFAHSTTVLWGRSCDGNAPARWCGQVLAAGGKQRLLDGLAAAELYDPPSGRWAPAAIPNSRRGAHGAHLLPDGKVLVAGGGKPFFEGQDQANASAEVYDPDRDRWTYTSSMATGRAGPSVLLDGPACRRQGARPRYCGGVLALGGVGSNDNPFSSTALASVELYIAAPTLASVEPRVAGTPGGTVVTITGRGFHEDSLVSFGRVPGTALAVAHDRLVAVAPPRHVGAADVAVTNTGGTSATLEPDPAARFEYLGVPGAVEGLAARPLSESAIEVAFDAADDGSGSRPGKRYAIKLATTRIEDFDAASNLCEPHCVLETAARRVVLTINDLEPGTEYFVAVRAVNDAGLVGPVAGPVSASTLGTRSPPCAGVAPGPGQLFYAGGRYHLVGLPENTVLGDRFPFYTWVDQGAGGAYALHAPAVPLVGGRGYWAYSRCDRPVIVSGGVPEARLLLGAYHASMVGNPSGISTATVTGHDFAARWDPHLNGGSGGYVLSGYREAQGLAVGEGIWVFSYVHTEIRIEAAG